MRGLIRLAGLAAVAVFLPAPSHAKDAADLSFSTDDEASQRKSDQLEIDWGTGFATLAGERFREGRKRGGPEAGGPSWSRGFSGEFTLGKDIGSLGAGVLRLNVDYIKRGSAIGSLLTRKSKSLDRELSIGLASHSGLSTSLLAFDKGGWTFSNPADFARRVANGEGRVRSGFGWSVGGKLGGDSESRSWSLRAERSRSPGLATESRAMLSARFGF